MLFAWFIYSIKNRMLANYEEANVAHGACLLILFRRIRRTGQISYKTLWHMKENQSRRGDEFLLIRPSFHCKNLQGDRKRLGSYLLKIDRHQYNISEIVMCLDFNSYHR